MLWANGGRVWRVQPINGQLAAGRAKKRRALVGRDAQLLGQQRGDLARWPALLGLDLLDRNQRAANLPRQVGLRQIERLAPPPHPVAKRGWFVHSISPARC